MRQLEQTEIQQIDDIVTENQSEIIDFLARVIQTPSVTGDELAVSEVCKKQIEAMGLPVEVIGRTELRPNLVAQWTGSQEGKTFVFNGHYDVFPPVAENNGLYGPWSGKIVDGKMYGRGTVDMKSGLCATIMAVAMLRKMGFDPKGTVVLSCDCDEEKGGYYGVEYLLEQGYLKGDYGLCAEPTAPHYAPEKSGVLVTGSSGVRVDIDIYAETCHSAIPHPNMNAIEKAEIVIGRFKKYAKWLQDTRVYPGFGTGPFCTVTQIHAGEGDAHNMHPGHCRLVIDRRIYPNEDWDTAIGEINKLMENLQKENPLIEYAIHYTPTKPGYKLDPDTEGVQAAMEAYEEICGESTFLYERPGGCDAHEIVEKYHYSMPTFGPGNEAQSCMENEWVAVSEYLKFVKVYMAMVMKLLS